MGHSSIHDYFKIIAGSKISVVRMTASGRKSHFYLESSDCDAALLSAHAHYSAAPAEVRAARGDTSLLFGHLSLGTAALLLNLGHLWWPVALPASPPPPAPRGLVPEPDPPVPLGLWASPCPLSAGADSGPCPRSLPHPAWSTRSAHRWAPESSRAGGDGGCWLQPCRLRLRGCGPDFSCRSWEWWWPHGKERTRGPVSSWLGEHGRARTLGASPRVLAPRAPGGSQTVLCPQEEGEERVLGARPPDAVAPRP